MIHRSHSLAGPMRRIPHLDVLRGIAMLGILPVNLLWVAMPLDEQLVPNLQLSGAETAADAWVTVLHEFKFITLFSLLFGAGMALAYRRLGETLEPYANVMLRRLLTLLPIGVLHGVLLWQGDVLSTYAPLGLALCWFVAMPRAAQWLLAVGGLMGSLMVLSLAMMGADQGDSWQQPWMVEAYTSGTYWEVVQARAVDWGIVWVTGLFVFGGRIGGCFLIGMAVVQSGWLERVQELRRTWVVAAVVGVIAGLSGEWAAWQLARSGSDSNAALAAGEALHYVASLVLAVGYAAVVVLVIEAGRKAEIPAKWTRPFEAVGRTAFSNYVLQSVCMNVVFLPGLLGYYDRFDRVQLLQVAVGIWALELVLSVFWLRWFRIGPLEWAWRSVTYWRLQPLLRD